MHGIAALMCGMAGEAVDRVGAVDGAGKAMDEAGKVVMGG